MAIDGRAIVIGDNVVRRGTSHPTYIVTSIQQGRFGRLSHYICRYWRGESGPKYEMFFESEIERPSAP